MSTGQIGILAAIIIYLAAMVYVGFYFSKKGGGDSADEFYLGGRQCDQNQSNQDSFYGPASSL